MVSIVDTPEYFDFQPSRIQNPFPREHIKTQWWYFYSQTRWQILQSTLAQMQWIYHCTIFNPLWSFVYQYVTSPYNIKPVCKNSRHTYQLEIVILMWNRILITIYKYNLAARKSRITKYNPKVKGLSMEAGREGVVYLFSKLVLTQCKVNSN